MPSLFQKASSWVALSVFVCANELLKKKKAHSLLEAMLRLKQARREGGKYPKTHERGNSSEVKSERRVLQGSNCEVGSDWVTGTGDQSFVGNTSFLALLEG